MYALYSFLLTFAALFAIPYWFIKGLREKKYLATVSQRISWKLPEVISGARPLWIHAVSVGEVLAAKVLFAALRSEHPEMPICISTVTLTGQALARKELGAAAAHFYFPFDWAFCVRRFIRRLNPRAVMLLETEIWPNFLRVCAENRIPTFIANGRISDKSFRRYMRIRFLTRSMLRRVRAVGTQTESDRQRYIQIGAEEGKVRVTGNLKFEFAAPDLTEKSELLQAIRQTLGIDAGSRVIVVGSTMKGEEPLFIDAYSRVRAAIPATRLILAPRHPERFDEVADLIRRSGKPFQRRSMLRPAANDAPEILLLDSVGELRPVYSLASVAVIGGSYLPFGGHNPLEPAALGKAIIFGPEMSNFREIARLLLRERAARQCGLEDLAGTMIELLQDQESCAAYGQRAAAVIRKNQGAARRSLMLLQSELK